MAALSSTPQPGGGPPHGVLAWLACLARAIVFPFDRVLAGMVKAGLCIDALCHFLGITRAILDEHIVRLGLFTPNDKPFRKPSAAGWSIEDTQKLIAWRTAGVHPEIVGQSLSKLRSANAVRAKSRRLGLQAPARASLFRPDPATLTRHKPDFGFSGTSASPETACGHAAGPATGTPAFPEADCGRAAGAVMFRPVSGSEPAPPAEKRVAARCRNGRPNGQRELPLFGVVGGAEHKPGIVLDRPPVQAPAPAKTPAPAIRAPVLAPVPRTREEIDYGNLTWIGALRQPLTSEVAVFAVGMLFMCGLHWRKIAEMVGKTPASLRTLRSRMGIPVDDDRKKIRDQFDEQVARETIGRADYTVRQSLNTERQKSGALYFWVERTDHATRLSPVHRKRDRMIEGRSPQIEIITREQLDAEARARTRSFATDQFRISAYEQQRVRPCATSNPPSRDGFPIPTSRARSSAGVSA